MMKTILVVDDSRTVRYQVTATLTSGGYEVVQAADGQEGLLVAGRGTALSLIICDFNMPRMSGLEFVEAYRGLPSEPKVPIVMLTSEMDPDTISQTKRAGACGWMVKPLRADLLLATVRQLAGPPD
jgi:two-component system, chemotaxis family, chemotaxis protein CheY